MSLLLELYSEECLSEYVESTELRTYTINTNIDRNGNTKINKSGNTNGNTNGDTNKSFDTLLVFSNSVFKLKDKIYRINKGIDVDKNCKSVMTNENVRLLDDFDSVVSLDFIKKIRNSNLEQGEYVLMDKKIYKILEETSEQTNLKI